MSDIYLKTQAITDMVIVNGVPQLTDGLDNAVYLSLFMPDWWGNDIAAEKEDEQYQTEIPRIMAEQTLTNQTRLDIIEEAKKSTQWMLDLGIVSAIDIRAEIPEIGKLYLAVTITEPEQDDPSVFAYSLNWDAQEIIIQESLW